MNTYSKQLDLLGRRYLRWLSRVVPSIAFLDRIALRIDRSRVHTRWPVAVRVRETRPGHVSPIVRLDRGWSLLIGYIQLPSTIPPMFLLFRNSSTDFDYILVLFLFFFFFFFITRFSFWENTNSDLHAPLLSRRPCLIARTCVARRARARWSALLAHRDSETQPCDRLTDWRLRLTLCGGADYP